MQTSASVCPARLRVSLRALLGAARRHEVLLYHSQHEPRPTWQRYSEEHRHSGIALLTPALVRFGETQTVRAHRQATAQTDGVAI